jgi:hypothetical protein
MPTMPKLTIKTYFTKFIIKTPTVQHALASVGNQHPTKRPVQCNNTELQYNTEQDRGSGLLKQSPKQP